MSERLEKKGSLLQKEYGEQKARVVVMLGAKTINPEGTDEWQFPLFSKDQTNSGTSLPGEVSGGWSRMRAIQSAYAASPEGKPEKMVVLVTGGKDSSGQSRSEEAARELIQRYGLPQDSVESIGGVATTLGNAAATVEYVRSHENSLGTVTSIDLVTNDYHMLRAWIMFSQGILESTTGKELAISKEDKEQIKRLLDEGLPDSDTWSIDQVSETRKKAMAILKPYFAEAKIHASPLVVEDVLQSDTASDLARDRYARMLRNNHWVRETIQFEYKGIKDLLDGKYKGR